MNKKFYCNKCNEDISLKNGTCPNCGTNWEELISESVDGTNSVSWNQHVMIDEKQEVDEFNNVNGITLNDINNNVYFFLTWATILKIICFVLSSIFLFCTFLLYDPNDIISLWFLVPCLSFFLFGFVVKNNLKWKAYMLYTNLDHNQRLLDKK